MDAGSAPGGWTQYLLTQHCQKVYAVDPADMVIPPTEAFSHMKMKVLLLGYVFI
jgi:23S rRNA U2552 (ribose-2'-O)-methylase RlmE/FtsJ